MTHQISEAQITDILNKAIQLTRRNPQDVQKKSHQDYVTDVDTSIDRMLTETLPQVQDVPVLSEERVADAPAELDAYWMIDPLDGTANLIAGLPFYAVAIALIDNLGPKFAAVASCTDGNVWIASRGQGASLNGQPIHLPDTPQSELIVLSTGLLDRLQSFPDAYKSVRSVGKIRNLGSQALHLCSAASGRFAAVASKEARVWDEAAGGLIVREAGGVWHSAADGADWTRPGALMEMEQNSVAGHPASSDAMVRVLGPVLGKVC
ncbi:inositol monophosphatase family protein [Roseovarius indicus]|uniref:inositol monophosphatase family protein n=1 Tax=Roseovarius indicus TaxID=540747 RepID=UPI0032ECE89F